ncbi:hypothetical protein EIP86_001152 [Pleurotus ostreatoroseus]|nr:hypothetical protein EIP86_001152 [Pleurotus ostreatoroseus]
MANVTIRVPAGSLPSHTIPSSSSRSIPSDSTSPSTAKESQGSPNVGALVGGVVGGLCGALLLVVIINVHCWRRERVRAAVAKARTTDMNSQLLPLSHEPSSNPTPNMSKETLGRPNQTEDTSSASDHTSSVLLSSSGSNPALPRNQSATDIYLSETQRTQSDIQGLRTDLESLRRMMQTLNEVALELPPGYESEVERS